MQITAGMKAILWERAVLAALPALVASDVTIEEAAGMAMDCADRLVDGYAERFHQPACQEEEVCLRE